MFAFDLLGTPKIAFDSGHVGVAMDAARHLRVGYFIHGAHPRRGDVAAWKNSGGRGADKGKNEPGRHFFAGFLMPRLTRGALRAAYRVCLRALDVRKICPTMAL